MTRPASVAVALAIALAGTAAVAAGSAPAGPDPCVDAAGAAEVAAEPGAPRLRFGINPAGEAGTIGPTVAAVPDSPGRTREALERLAPGRGSPFYVRLNRFFWSDGKRGIQRFRRLADRYTRRGYLVELQLRYHPRPEQEGRIGRWLRFVRRVVRRFGPDPGVRSLQVTNEVNFYPIAPDASDSYYAGAREALVRGVIAADREAHRLGHEQLRIGFNWAYTTDPAREREFWTEIASRGGRRFRRALDWVGLDAYPGTLLPAVTTPDGYGDGIATAIRALRECHMAAAGIPASVPIKVEENGYPTAEPQRSYATQAEALRQMVRTVSAVRGAYNVTDYRWFDLRDHRTSSANLQHQYGLLRDDYEPKPAFAAYRRLIGRLTRRGPAG